ncbi:hypothetical protein BRADI_1g37242v3 [Brachypodium distachyon]|uniref:Uncharacterized protein n=1 Tax=Brachypodium distachyon TaxID=15368 RepID=A0A2K2DN58_BRADI|nr:hypothetical protein BRADI_1g37242v3 [Brachypodium distachyon]
MELPEAPLTDSTCARHQSQPIRFWRRPLTWLPSEPFRHGPQSNFGRAKRKRPGNIDIQGGVPACSPPFSISATVPGSTPAMAELSGGRQKSLATKRCRKATAGRGAPPPAGGPPTQYSYAPPLFDETPDR